MDNQKALKVKSKSGEKLVFKLKKSLYGLKQSGRSWNSKLYSHLTEQRFVQSNVDHCVYTKHLSKQSVQQTILIVWVDDTILASNIVYYPIQNE